jgi:hypothetical protein
MFESKRWNRGEEDENVGAGGTEMVKAKSIRLNN